LGVIQRTGMNQNTSTTSQRKNAVARKSKIGSARFGMRGTSHRTNDGTMKRTKCGYASSCVCSISRTKITNVMYDGETSNLDGDEYFEKCSKVFLWPRQRLIKIQSLSIPLALVQNKGDESGDSELEDPFRRKMAEIEALRMKWGDIQMSSRITTVFAYRQLCNEYGYLGTGVPSVGFGYERKLK